MPNDPTLMKSRRPQICLGTRPQSHFAMAHLFTTKSLRHQRNTYETTDEHGSVLLNRKSLQAAQGFPPRYSWERTHPAGSVRSQGRSLRVLCVSAVRFFLVAAELLRVHLV